MRSLMLAVRGIWWRRWSSVAIVAIGLICAALAAAAVTFGVNAREAVLQATVRHASPYADGTGTTVVLALDGSVSRTGFADQTTAAYTPLQQAGFLGAPEITEYGDKGVLDATGQQLIATVPLLYRTGSCAQVTMRAGQCVSEADPHGVIVTAGTAAAQHWTVGTSIEVGDLAKHQTVHIRGIYVAVAPASGYWFGRSAQYFGADGHTGSPANNRTEAVIVPGSFWDQVAPPIASDDVSVAADFALVPGGVHVSDADRLQSMTTAAAGGLLTSLLQGTDTAAVNSQLSEILSQASTGERSVGAPILAVGAQLLILTWLVLYLILVRSADARTGEVVLGKLRGLTLRETVLHATLEPLLLVLIAVPAGVAVCAVALRTAGRTILGSHSLLVLPDSAWVAAAIAGLGGVVAVVVTSVAMLRRSVISQWRHTERRPRRGGWALDAVVATLALAGFVQLVEVPASLGTAAEFLPSCAPALLAITLAVVGTRLVPLLARAGLRRTRRSTHIATFIAVRQLARRSADVRVFVLLTVAVALVVFAVASGFVFRSNGHQRALTELGADRVVSINSAPGVDPEAVVARLDPSGHWASAVYAGGVTTYGGPATDSNSAGSSLLVVDPATFARVAFWRPDFGSSAHLADQLTPLRSAPPTPVTVSLTSLDVAATVQVKAALPVTLHAGLTDRAGREVDVTLGQLTPTRPGGAPVAIHFAATVPGCAAGCQLRRFSIQKTVYDQTLPQVTVAFSAVDALSATVTQSVLPALAATTWTSPDTNQNGLPAVTASTSSGRLSLAFRPAFTPANYTTGYEIVSNVPADVPALVTTTQLTAGVNGLNAYVAQASIPIALRPTRVDVLPQGGQAGVLISRAWLPAARPDGYDQFQPNQVWLSASAPGDFPARLAAAGLTVTGVRTAAGLAHQTAALGPVFAVDMLVFGAAAAAILAVVGAATSLLVAARRRLYELAALRSLGARPRVVLTSIVLEQGAITVAAALLGLAAGLIGARTALGRLPEFADQPSYPRLVYDLPIVLCALLALVVVAAVVVSVGLGSLELVRLASANRLREAET